MDNNHNILNENTPIHMEIDINKSITDSPNNIGAEIPLIPPMAIQVFKQVCNIQAFNLVI